MKFEFTDQETMNLAEALGYAPYSRVAPLIQRMQAQINEQKVADVESRTS